MLLQLVTSYNNSRHRSIGMAPADVRDHDQDRIWTRLYGDGDTYRKQRVIPAGAMVRINKAKGVFDKGYMPNWSREHFTVADAPPTRRGIKRRVDKIHDYNNEPVSGSWYDEELQHISDNQYYIELVLRRQPHLTAANNYS